MWAIEKHKSCAAGLCHEDGVPGIFCEKLLTGQHREIDHHSVAGRGRTSSTRWMGVALEKCACLELVGVFDSVSIRVLEFDWMRQSESKMTMMLDENMPNSFDLIGERRYRRYK
jgi:hypothetical protein